MKRLILSVLVVFAIAAAVVGCGSSNTSSGNMELQGTWKATDPADNTTTITFTFNGNQWTMTEASTSMALSFQMSGTFTLDSAVNPRTIDLYITACSIAPDQVGTTLHSIYQLNGTNLAIANGQGGTRPTSFTADNTANLVKQ
jgi:uncharacterized protein (TIGR03067 family)